MVGVVVVDCGVVVHGAWPGAKHDAGGDGPPASRSASPATAHAAIAWPVGVSAPHDWSKGQVVFAQGSVVVVVTGGRDTVVVGAMVVVTTADTLWALGVSVLVPQPAPRMATSRTPPIERRSDSGSSWSSLLTIDTMGRQLKRQPGATAQPVALLAHAPARHCARRPARCSGARWCHPRP